MQEGDWVKFVTPEGVVYDVGCVVHVSVKSVQVERGYLGKVAETEYANTPYVFGHIGHVDPEENP